MNIYFVRHGATEWNNQEKIQGTSDIKLSKQGISNTIKTANFLKSYSFKNIFTSNLSRAKQTAKIISKENNNIPVSSFDYFNELDCGDWEGITLKNIKTKRAKEYNKLSTDPYFKIPNGESFANVEERFKKGWPIILEKSNNQNFVFITHIVITRVFLFSFIGIPYKSLRRFKIDNSSVSIIQKDNNKCFINLWNYKPYKDELYQK